jgi:hypothetical protein
MSGYGQALGEAIEQVDRETGGIPSCFMINCAHPTHFASVVEQGDAWRERDHGLRANASTRSHAELEEADELDEGDPAELGVRYAGCTGGPRLNILGGCCGTDDRARRRDPRRMAGERAGVGTRAAVPRTPPSAPCDARSVSPLVHEPTVPSAA